MSDQPHGRSETDPSDGTRPEDTVPVDALTVAPRPDAQTAGGEPVDNQEIEASSELSRVGRRLGIAPARVDGFGLFRGYTAYRGFREGLSTRVRSILPTASEPAAEETVTGEARLLRDRLVEARWAEIRLLSRLPPRAANDASLPELEREREFAERTLAKPEPWESLPDSLRATYGRPPNHPRIRRTLDFIGSGERILDIGAGYGYLSSILLRDRAPSHYCAIDIVESCVNAIGDAVAICAGPDAEVEVGRQDIYEIDAAFMARHEPSLVLLLEVMEHLPDPGLALRKLAPGLGPEAAVIFTVPMPGRLEGVWGHLSLFDQARVSAICESAGLFIQYVEPIQNTWMLVVASRTDEVLPRVRRALAEPRPAHGAGAVLSGHSIEEIAVGPDGGLEVTGAAELAGAEGAGVQITVPAGETAGVRVPIGAYELVKAEISYDAPAALQAVSVETRDRRDKPIHGWEWKVSDRGRPDPGRRFTHVFRDGRPVGLFRPRVIDPSREPASLVLTLTAGEAPAVATLRRTALFPTA